MIRRCLLALPVFLFACVGGGPSTGAFRNTAAPIWSAAALSYDQLAGEWTEVAAFTADRVTCSAGTLRLTPTAGGLRVAGSLCLNGTIERPRGLARETGPGRLTLAGEEWWVLWVDSGYRTLVIGTPSGRFGMVLDRGAIAADRLQAAHEVLDFNGYDTSMLQSF